ncbi:RNA 2',3'-cyclic phosphodiesterase [Ancylomarina longa]|uniref:RNA 2',3'-cyclic phosphodiesterase n=1 Tax=Ancylomarina longa TaxID=2487017 RepID=A0A434AVI0_9BACT|nr:RNA 2',3'-cyclic phosphodiesterase [Ancylomarina longa]RUT78459.1 RNA 2',3'-cyclic phosphodiesterase [Ancylomarina longa]
MTSKRLFVAIKIANTNQIRAIFRQVQLELDSEQIKWVDLNGIHITLGFMGSTDTRKIPMIKNRLKVIAANSAPFSIQLKSMGAFPSLQRPRILWLGVNTSNTIFDLQKEILKQMEYIAPIKATHFFPHLTFGRIKHGVQNPKLVEKVLKKYESWQEKEVLIGHFVLMESVLTKSGPIYKVIEQFKLGNSME